MLAFKTCVRAGLIPQAKQGGRGVSSLAVAGSKLDGTGFGKLQIVQTQVADVEGAGVAVADRCAGAVDGAGEAVPLPDGVDAPKVACDAREDRFATLGIKVTFGEDLKKPACQ